MNVSELLDLVSNPDKYKAALQEMESRQKALDEAVAAYGQASKIPALYDAAERTLKTARKEADEIVEAANRQEQDRKKLLDAEFAKVEDKLAEAHRLASIADQRSREAKLKEQSADSLLKEYNTKLANLHQKEQELSEKEVEINLRLAKLRSVMS